MGRVLSFFRDGLANALTGQGTARDPRSASSYIPVAPLTQQQIAAAYAGSGILKKIVQIPALDMVREWREMAGLEPEQASAIYDEEQRLAIPQKVQQAEVLRGLGGGALILGLPGQPYEEARPGAAKSLAFVHVVSRWHLSFDQLNDDATQPGYGEPAMWRMNTAAGQRDIHPSRVVPFRADTSGSLLLTTGTGADLFWGEGRVAQVLDPVKDFDTVRGAFAALAHKARSLRIGVRGLYEMIAAGKEDDVSTRLALMATAESIHNAIVFDAGDEEGKGGEKIEDATYSFAGAKDLLNAYAEFVAAISDIPATRLLGRAPEGMNASGDSQQQDWRKKVRALQTLELKPCLDRLDRYLVPSAIGSMPPTYSYDFNPLDTETETERAARFKTEAEAVKIVADTGTVPEEALAKGVQSWLVEEGHLPELEAALAKLPDDVRYGIPAEAGIEEGGDRASAEGGAGEEAPPLRRAANDRKMTAADIGV